MLSKKKNLITPKKSFNTTLIKNLYIFQAMLLLKMRKKKRIKTNISLQMVSTVGMKRITAIRQLILKAVSTYVF